MNTTSDIQVLTLALGQEIFAFPVGAVREILEYQTPYALPDGPRWFKGLIDARGNATPVIDLRTKLGLPPVPPDGMTRIVVLDVSLDGKSLALGFVADKVCEVAHFGKEQCEPIPDIGVSWNSNYISSIVRRGSEFVVLFDLARMITENDAAMISAPSSDAVQ